MTSLRSSPGVLIIRDGWGANPNPSHAAFDAVRLARTPVADRLMREFPWTLVKTSGEDVGLPPGTMGNSEVGHQNIGAGRVVAQESLLMTVACDRGLEHNEAIAGAMTHARAGGRSLHVMGINSDAGVHGQLAHLFAILRAAKAMGLAGDRVFVHLFMDGRDTGPFTGLEYARRVEAACRETGVGRIASVMGRYYAMDRDHRWERVRRAYDCLTGRGLVEAAADAGAAIQGYYDAPSGETLKGDEFVTPTAIGDAEAVRVSRVRDGDAVVFFNYRGDRPRELSAAFCFPDELWSNVKASPDTGVRGFERGGRLALHFVTMTDYWETLTAHVSGVAFAKPARLTNIAGEWIAGNGLGQVRCAETEKYPHVTFFFNDYRDPPYAGEVRLNPPSPKVATYDLKPEMAAAEVRDAVLARLRSENCEAFLIVNFANADMVGHTGSLEAAVAACETVDQCVGDVVDAALARGGFAIVTADHGNAEQMFDPATGSPHTAHTVYDVPLIVAARHAVGRSLRGDRDIAGWFDPAVRAARGRLSDIMPTMFDLAGLAPPAEMTGRTLLLPG
ncbi:MAG: 2,3-bisphosphoglycerate-independent phosphoglycerate mutase [Planctomycetota bacterium]|nr:2,3-bisphosphoglycerate-independent phosphoglycerate mutase [Planctomycetota bacterium]